MSSTKPYLLRAIYEWAEDNLLTAQVLVNADAQGVDVPLDHVVDGQIVLNVSSAAVKIHTMDNDGLRFSARFNGVERNIILPIASILAIFARENSQGIFFEDFQDTHPDPDPDPIGEKQSKQSPQKDAAANKRNTSHLKIIK